jgi:pyruvate kinase
MRRTKLVCTIGPASVDRVHELVQAGMDVARLNFSHGTDEDHLRAADAVRRAADQQGRVVAILADLPGPKVRLAELPDGGLELAAGQRFRLGPGARPPDGAETTHPTLAADLDEGDRLMLADGAVELRVTGRSGDVLETEVVRGDVVRSGAGLNAPSERLQLPAVTDRDRAALETIRAIGADYVAQSFVRTAGDVRQLRDLMGEASAPIMAKIETRSAVEQLPAILAEVDALMLARGDLGVEIAFEEVPIIQKRVIDASVAAGIPVVVATQMLESMVSAPRPTRAEASDVANAVLDGADAVMLSAESAIGAYPVLAARAAASICEAAETDPAMVHRPAPLDPAAGGSAAAIAEAAVALVRERRDPALQAIACFTRSGTTARLLARLRPGRPILALSPDGAVVRKLALLRGVVPVASSVPADTDQMIGLMDRSLRDAGFAPGAEVVLVASIPFGAARTNVLKLHRLGDGA